MTSVAVSPKNRLVVSGSWDHSVRLWSAAKGAELYVLGGHNNCEDVGAVEKDSNRIWRNGGKKGLDLLTQICIPAASGAERDGVCFPLFPVGLRKSTDFLFSLCSAPL